MSSWLCEGFYELLSVTREFGDNEVMNFSKIGIFVSGPGTNTNAAFAIVCTQKHYFVFLSHRFLIYTVEVILIFIMACYKLVLIDV